MDIGARYASTILGVLLLGLASLAAPVAYVKLPRVPRTSALLVVLVASLLVRPPLLFSLGLFSPRSHSSFSSRSPLPAF